MWRQLTSMRTALFLLLLLAVGAVPGSIWPQRSIDAARTADYIADHPTAGPWLDRLGFFEVYASPWFAAIYLLLFISLVGCVLPRSKVHWKAMRSAPPKAPARPAGCRPTARSRSQRLRTRSSTRRGRCCGASGSAPSATTTRSVSAEKGYLKETGNLVFHLSLIFVIIGVAIGHLFGWKGDVIVPGRAVLRQHPRATTTPSAPGRGSTPTACRRSSSRSTSSTRPSRRTSPVAGQFGSPRDFTAHVTTKATPDVAAAEVDDQGQPPAGDEGRRRLPPRQRLRPGHHRPRRQGRQASTAGRRRSSPRTTTTRRSGW